MTRTTHTETRITVSYELSAEEVRSALLAYVMEKGAAPQPDAHVDIDNQGNGTVTSTFVEAKNAT